MASPNLQLTGGNFQNAAGTVIANGVLLLTLSHDEEYVAGSSQVVAGLKAQATLNAQGNIPSSPALLVYSNDALLPAGSYYSAELFDSKGTRLWQQFWTLASSPNPLNVGTIVPVSPPGSGLSAGNASNLLLQTNEVNNGSQSLLDLHAGTNVTLTDNGLGQITIAGASAAPSFNTAGLGYFWSFAGVVDAGAQPVTSVSLTQGSTAVTAVANAVICFQLALNVSYTVRKISLFISGAATGGASCAIYDGAGTTRLLDAGASAFNTANVATMQTVTLGAPVVLSAGVYWFACSATSATPASSVGQSLSAGSAGYSSYFNTVVRAGSSANALVGGAMPSSLGTITAFPSGTFNCPGFFFQV